MTTVITQEDLTVIYSKMFEKFMKFAKRLYGSSREEDAKDNVSEIFARLLEKAPIEVELSGDTFETGRKIIYGAIKKRFISDLRKYKTARKFLGRVKEGYVDNSYEYVLKLLRDIDRTLTNVDLTLKEKSVWSLMQNGFSTEEIASSLKISKSTVYVHGASISRKITNYMLDQLN